MMMASYALDRLEKDNELFYFVDFTPIRKWKEKEYDSWHSVTTEVGTYPPPLAHMRSKNKKFKASDAFSRVPWCRKSRTLVKKTFYWKSGPSIQSQKSHSISNVG